MSRASVAKNKKNCESLSVINTITDESEDVLTIYKSSARRYQKIKVSTADSNPIIPLPQTIVSGSLLAVFNNLDTVPFEVTNSQLILEMPSGIARVQTEDGKTIEGLVQSVNGSTIVLHHPKNEKMITINNYQSISYSDRYWTRHVNLSYLLQGLSWEAEHFLFVDVHKSIIIKFTTQANVTNTTGVIFDLTSLQLGIGDPFPTTAYDEGANNEAHESRSLAAAPRAEYKRARKSSMVTSFKENGSVEDYDAIDVGSQKLRATGRFEILKRENIPARKLYKTMLVNNNEDIQLGYRFKVPANTHIASGRVIVEAVDSKTKRLGMRLGATYMDEQSQNAEVDLMLGRASLVQIFTTIVNIRKTKQDMKKWIQKSERLKLYINEQKNSSETNLYEDEDSENDENSDDDQNHDQNQDEGIDELGKIDKVHKVKERLTMELTTITCTFQNHSTKDIATIIASYPLLKDRKILKISTENSQVKRNNLEFMFEIKPNKLKKWTCEILSEINNSPYYSS